MNENKILHVMILDKFLAPFINFVDENFGRENHHYVFITSEKYNYGLTAEHEVEFLYTDDDIFITLLEYMKMAKKIILHGLWRDKIDFLLSENLFLLKKAYWIVWGGDIFFPETKTQYRKKVIENMGYIISGTKKGYEYAKKHYNANGKNINSFIYPSNFFKESNRKKQEKTTNIKILVGNSSTETNCHINIFEKLKIFKNDNIEIYTPLSYGNFKYGMYVMKYGYEIFKDKFHPLIDFMLEEDYYNFLEEIDIAIFDQTRQQGMGNIITLLGFGKKVYLNPDIFAYNLFLSQSIMVYDVHNINLKLLEENIKNKNIELVSKFFSKQKFIKELNYIFNEVQDV